MSPALKERGKRRAVAAGAAGLVAGAALGVLQILQQTIGAWHPKREVSALIVVAAVFASVVVASLRNRRARSAEFGARRRRLSDLAGVWPAPLVRDADPMRLGVFPASRQIEPAAPYVARGPDEALRAAMVAGAVVLVVGEPRAGATRTALEAARSALGEAIVLAPRTASSLLELAELDPPLEFGDRHVLVWLDGLDRYVDALDAECLTALGAIAGRVTVLATIRRELWDQWLRATGSAGEAARALTAQARVFELPALLSPSELEAARRCYPDTDFSGGIGEALGSTGGDSAPPRPPQAERAEQEEPDPTPPWWRDPDLVLPALATCATLLALGLVVAISGFRTLSINDQIAADEREGSRGERHAAFVMQVDLHGSDVKSWLVVFRDDVHARRPRSDELRIYDEHGEKLVRALRFEPVGERAVFQERTISDIDFDGAQEIVGGYGYADESKGGGAIVPFAIDWERSRQRYAVVSLDQGSPTLSRNAIDIPEKQYRRVYAGVTAFSDPVDHLEITGHRVQDFAVSPAPHRLVAGWFLRPWLGQKRATFELHTAIFDSSTGGPHLTPCTLSGLRGPLLAHLGKDRAPHRVFEETYAEASRARGCLPVYG